MLNINKIIKNLLSASLLCLLLNAPVLSAEEQDLVSIGEGEQLIACIAQFPCHMKTGRVLPNLKSSTDDCGWERICKNYRQSAAFKKLQQKLRKQKRISKRNTVKIKSRLS